MGLTLLLLLFIVLLVLGTPVSYALAMASFLIFAYEGIPIMMALETMVTGMSSFSLLAVPFFIFAGELMLHGGIAHRLVKLASSMVGWVRGGLGQVNVLSSMFFGGISGSAVADVSALGSLLIPVMKQKGYDTDYAVNITVTSSIAGIVIPPSHNMILYAVAAGGGISISKLFVAGIFPGILMCLALTLVARYVAIRRQYPTESFAGVSVMIWAFISALPGLATAVIIVGGSLSGVFTVTEAGAIGAIYAIIVSLLVYRELDFQRFLLALKNAVRTTAMVMFLVGSSAAFGYLLALYQVPELLMRSLLWISENPLVILLILNIILLALGTIMDMAALILICTPIFLPIALSLGMNPIQFGIMLMMNLGIGLCTPPVGSCLFVGCAIGKLPMQQAIKTIWPFYIALFVTLMLVTYVPVVSMFLPSIVD